jgi:hypothetical protein
MRTQSDSKTYEVVRTERRAERHSEEQRLAALKTQLQKNISEPRVLFAAHADGRVNAA